ncbi:cAMP-binding domain of CRP or a regulatory subunit of cAMP-dependent protein kinases [Lutibacter oricola]|uniref:cAMP-binding domain of CRP or a regulatory subunit of cAMP-dependent protein kinases n=1 Tax=Lutibacter oricola TaxID=762486 RepID=A0A1H2VU93_9FLAO|nr:Crp/Fnr family transcriptional regulator [Lutibacter oricola]SDW71915.1 cAMP-binding domain of CRP or a regulatory subunit of cAMP-dependent protein kinases [Lutibacter oricola]
MSRCTQCIIKRFNSLKKLTHDELEKFSDHKTSLLIKKGENLMTEGHTINGLYCVKDGKCKLTKLNTNGKEQIIKFVKGGDILGHRSILSDEPVGLNVTALEDMHVCFIPKGDILDMIRTNSQFSLSLMKNISHQLNEANTSISQMAQKPVKDRLAETLIHLEEIFGVDKEGFIDITLTREEIANTIGTATESAIRLLSNLKKDGVIDLTGKRIRIKEKATLHNISEGY